MSPPVIDQEMLAAFLDGRASPAERERVMALIAGSQQAYDEFCEAVAIQREAERLGAAAEPGRPESGERVRPSGLSRRALAIPTMLVAASLAFFLIPRSGDTTAPLDAGSVAAAVLPGGASGAGSVARTLGPQWDEPGWPVMRGSEPAVPEHAGAFRVGVRFAQLSLSVVAQDSVATVAAAAALQHELRDVDGSASVAAALGPVATSGVLASTELGQLSGRVRAVSGSPAWFDLGTWLGAARMATASSQAAFFRTDGAPMAALAQHLRQPASDDAQLEQVHRLLRALRPAASSASDSMPSLREQVDRAIRVAAGIR